MRTHTFTFADGRTKTVRLAVNNERGTGWRQNSIDIVIGIDPFGDIVGDHPSDLGSPFTLTDCCGASYKGTEGGVACRACFEYVEGGGLPWGEITPLVVA